VVLRPGVGVVGAWVDAQLGGVLWTIVDEHLLELQNVLDGPVVDVALVLATNKALLPLLGRMVGLGKLVQGRIRCRAWVNVATWLVHGLGIVDQPGIAGLPSLLLLLLVFGEADELPSVGANQRALGYGNAVVEQTLASTRNITAHNLKVQLLWANKLHATVST